MNVLDIWQGKPLDDVLSMCRDLVEDTTFPTVQRWRAAGGKVLGHFQVYFPEELAHAAGMLPVKMRGSQVDRKNADSHFGSYLCSIVRSSLETSLNGSVELDMFVTHPICDVARNLAGIWGRNFNYSSQILYLPQNANSAYSAQYLRDEYARVLRDIEQVTGKKVSEDGLRNSIAVFNDNRRLLREVYAIKRETPWLLSIDEAYVLVNLGGMIPREEHNELLAALIPEIKARTAKKQDKIRVVFEGGFCEQPPIDLLRVISQSCYVVDDDLLIGLRWILEDVPTTGDPLMNLADAYLNKSSYSPVQHDLRKPKEKMLLERMKNSDAHAAIITAAKMCEPGLEEQVAYSKKFDELNIPYFISEFEEKMTAYDSMQIQLETFVENILFE
ncbi:MAG: 2-hydroxyacyl-CoA dehydratase [Chloroflexota bacterium]|nr:2-hydroxyacyl-CoA dehydratase [Chloroflexota bacterium]